MTSEELYELVKKAESLNPDEQLFLISRLVEKMRENYQLISRRRKWSDICGSVSYPIMGEDAQVWISRTRHEEEESREKRLRREI